MDGRNPCAVNVGWVTVHVGHTGLVCVCSGRLWVLGSDCVWCVMRQRVLCVCCVVCSGLESGAWVSGICVLQSGSGLQSM